MKCFFRHLWFCFLLPIWIKGQFSHHLGSFIVEMSFIHVQCLPGFICARSPGVAKSERTEHSTSCSRLQIRYHLSAYFWRLKHLNDYSNPCRPLEIEVTVSEQHGLLPVWNCAVLRWRLVLYFPDTEFHTFFSRQVPISSDIHVVRTFPDMSGARVSCRSWSDCSLRPFP